MNRFPEKIVCLSNESIDILIRLECADRVVGAPVESLSKGILNATAVGGYGTIDIDKVTDLQPDIVFSYSDFQHRFVLPLLRKQLPVMTFSQSSLEGIFRSIRIIGNAVGVPERGEPLVAELRESIQTFASESRHGGSQPKVYFEEWNDPMVTGTQWVSEMIEIAGGRNIFSEKASHTQFIERHVLSRDILEKDPDIIFASWCGKKVDVETIRSRQGWNRLSAVRNNRIFELPGDSVLQPGPGILRGIEIMHSCIADNPSGTFLS